MLLSLILQNNSYTSYDLNMKIYSTKFLKYQKEQNLVQIVMSSIENNNKKDQFLIFKV